MLIETTRHDPNCPIPMPTEDGRWITYFFIPVEPQNADSPHVAEVTNKDHIQKFLKTEMYSPYIGADPLRIVKPVATDKPPRQHAAGKVPNHPTPVPYGQAPEITRTHAAMDAPAPTVQPIASMPSQDLAAPAPAALQTAALSVEQIGTLTVRDLRASLAAGSISRESLSIALAAERDRKDAPPRASWCDAAEQFLNGKLAA